ERHGSTAAPRREEGGVTSSLPAPHAEKNVVGPEASMHAHGLVLLDDLLGRVHVRRDARHAAIGVTIEPLEQLWVGEERRLYLPRALEIGKGPPGMLVE